MKIIKLKNLSVKKYREILLRSSGTNTEIMPQVRTRMEVVRKYGDKVFIGKDESIPVNREEINLAYKQVNRDFINALKQMIKNISRVHKAQLPNKKDAKVYSETGISVWREWRAIEKVGLYIPGGRAIYPSSVLMCAIPAKIAGCREIVMCTPPREKGRIPSATLVAADLAGITQIYKVGGIEAIAAMAYGTQTIPQVYKIFGAGNSFVTAAKMIALETVAVDMPAGPSEIFIIADASANPAYIAADLLADGEHGEDSACVLITTSEKIAKRTIAEIDKQLPFLATEKRARESLRKYGLIAVAESIDEAIEFTNEYAPEHLEIVTQNSERLVPKIKNAGSVFLGDFTTKASGDYATGANHVLPTGGSAKMYPPLGVDSYGKWMQVQKCTKEGLRKIRKTIETVADIEELPAHKNSTSIRFME